MGQYNFFKAFHELSVASQEGPRVQRDRRRVGGLRFIAVTAHPRLGAYGKAPAVPLAKENQALQGRTWLGYKRSTTGTLQILTT